MGSDFTPWPNKPRFPVGARVVTPRGKGIVTYAHPNDRQCLVELDAPHGKDHVYYKVDELCEPSVVDLLAELAPGGAKSLLAFEAEKVKEFVTAIRRTMHREGYSAEAIERIVNNAVVKRNDGDDGSFSFTLSTTVHETDAPNVIDGLARLVEEETCTYCGHALVRRGSCLVCPNDGSVSGCT
jgi:hypothetical protein